MRVPGSMDPIHTLPGAWDRRSQFSFTMQILPSVVRGETRRAHSRDVSGISIAQCAFQEIELPFQIRKHSGSGEEVHAQSREALDMWDCHLSL